MTTRTSIINNFKLNALAASAILQIGDSFILKPKAKVFAVQREVPFFWGDEGNLENYDIYYQAIPQPVITELVNMNIINRSPVIKVNNIRILGVSASSIVHIGSTKIIDAEARVKHIRYLSGGERPV